MSKLKGKVALVTGGASGIGLAITKRFLAEGAIVEILDWNQEEMDKAAAETGASAIRCDVSDHKMVDEVVNSIHAKHGRIDILVNNAGIAHPARQCLRPRQLPPQYLAPYGCR
jgi:NAD(P)-dependent dehydrogenase (short-subunit alcohol dehydrogenase family)